METPNTEPNSLNMNGLTHKDKRERLFDLLKSYPTHVSYSERMHSVAARTGITPKTLLQTARRNGWEAKLASIVAAQQEQEEYAKRLDAVAPLTVDIPNTRIAANIKQTAWKLLVAAGRYIDTTVIMLQLHSEKIATKVAEVGGVAYLDEAAIKQIAAWQEQLNGCANGLKPFITPGAITTLLNAIDFTSRLPINDETIETTHFTIAALQKKLLEMGMLSAFDQPKRAVAGFADGPVPIISGHVNTDKNNPLSYQDENTEPDVI